MNKVYDFVRALMLALCMVGAVGAQADSLYSIGKRKALADIKPGDKIIIESAALKANAGKYLKGQPEVALYAETSFVYSAGLNDEAIWEVVATGTNDPTYTAKPTYYLRMVKGGYYLGFATDSGISNIRSLTTKTANAYKFVLLNTTEAKTASGSSPNWDTNSVTFQATAKNIQLGNSPTASNNAMVWMWSPSHANAPTYCPWNVYSVEEGASAEEIMQELNDLLDIIKADTTDYASKGDFKAIKDYTQALAEAKQMAAGDTPGAMDCQSMLTRLQAAYQGVQTPKADMLDVVFNDDGTATDASPMQMPISKVGSPVVTYNKDYGRNMASLVNSYGGAGVNYYRTALYSTNQDFLAKLQDGHSLETVFRTRVEVANKEAKMLSSHQSGGTGLMISTQANGKNGGNEITFLPNIGGYKWATSGVVPEKDVFYHVVGVWNKQEGLAYIYVNGELKNTVGANGSMTLASASSQWFGIGCDPSGGNGEASGNWDIVVSRIYDQPLTDYQVGLLYGEQPEGEEPLVKNLDFMGGLTMAAGAKFPIDGEGFIEGDKIKLESGSKIYTLDLCVREGGCHFVIPDGMTSATYKMTLLRDEKTQTIGSCAFVIANKMPGGCAVIAHRGWWTKGAGTAQNSRASLRNAIELDVYGSETDVWITTDGHIMINHDSSLGGVGIQTNAYSRVKDLKLSNGETIPELGDFFDIMEEYPDSKTKLIIELKFNSSTNVISNAQKIVAYVKSRNMQQRVEYISYSLDACKELARLDPEAWVAYLGTEPLPTVQELYSYHVMGLDYQTSQFSNNPTFIPDAEKLGMTTNVYTIDAQSAMINVTNMGINFVTTNYPDIAKRIYRLYEYNLPEPISPDEKARLALEEYIKVVEADTTDYNAGNYFAETVTRFEEALANARQAVENAESTAAEYEVLQQNLEQAYKSIDAYPVADAFDVIFAQDGSAIDASPIASPLTGYGKIETYYSPFFDANVAMFGAAYGADATNFLQAQFAPTKSDGRLRDALLGGHALESVFRITQVAGAGQSHWFSAYNKGAVALMTCAPEEGLSGKNEISYLLNVSPGGSKNTPVVVPSGIEAKIDSFYHVVAVWSEDSAKACIYVNGTKMNEVATDGELHIGLATTYQWLCLGGAPISSASAGLGGSYDVVTARIYDKSLSPLQAQYLWDQAKEAIGQANADPTAIASVNAAPGAQKAAVWSADGRRLAKPQRGINIVRGTDGSVQKVLVK